MWKDFVQTCERGSFLQKKERFQLVLKGGRGKFEIVLRFGGREFEVELQPVDGGWFRIRFVRGG